MYGTDRRYASEGRPRRHPAEDWRETGGGGDGGIALHLAGTALSFIIAIILLVVGFASPNWIEIRTSEPDPTLADTVIETHIYRGLWKECKTVGSASEFCDATISSEEKTWYRVCQGLAMLTLAALVIITVYFLCWAYSYSRYYFNKIMILVIIGGTGLAVIANIVVFGVQSNKDFESYEFTWGYIIYSVSAPFVLIPFPLILFIPAYELSPDWSGPWYRRFGGRRRPAPPLRYSLPPPQPGDRGPKSYDYIDRRRSERPYSNYY